MILTIVAIVLIISVVLTVKVMRDIAEDLRGLDESTKTTEERKNERIRKEIEKWREGK